MNRIFLIPILFFLTLLVGVYFLLPLAGESSDLKKEVSKQELELKQKENYLANLKELSKKLKEYQETLEKIETALPQEPSLASLLSFFQTKSAESGLILKDLGGIASFQPEQEKSAIQEIQINFTLQGSFSAFENFLRLLEKSARLIEVRRISLEAGEEELLEFTLQVKTHSY